jgi:hypothetical protein
MPLMSFQISLKSDHESFYGNRKGDKTVHNVLHRSLQSITRGEAPHKIFMPTSQCKEICVACTN